MIRKAKNRYWLIVAGLSVAGFTLLAACGEPGSNAGDNPTVVPNTVTPSNATPASPNPPSTAPLRGSSPAVETTIANATSVPTKAQISPPAATLSPRPENVTSPDAQVQVTASSSGSTPASQSPLTVSGNVLTYDAKSGLVSLAAASRQYTTIKVVATTVVSREGKTVSAAEIRFGEAATVVGMLNAQGQLEATTLQLSVPQRGPRPIGDPGFPNEKG